MANIIAPERRTQEEAVQGDLFFDENGKKVDYTKKSKEETAKKKKETAQALDAQVKGNFKFVPLKGGNYQNANGDIQKINKHKNSNPKEKRETQDGRKPGENWTFDH